MKEKYRDFHFGEFIEKPNQCGCFERNGNWYTLQDHLMGAQ